MSLSCSDTEIVINQTTNISTQEEKYQEKDDLNRNYSDNCVNRMHNLEKETNTSENDDYELNFSQSTDSTKINVHQDKIRSRYKNNLKEQNESDSSNEWRIIFAQIWEHVIPNLGNNSAQNATQNWEIKLWYPPFAIYFPPRFFCLHI